MDFRDFAAKEAADLVGRLTKAAEADARSASERSAKDARAAAEKEAEKAAQKAAEKAAEDARQAARRAADEERVRTEAVSKELAAKTRESQELAAALKAAQAEVPPLQAEVASQRERADAAETALGDTRETLARVDGDRAQAEAALEQESRARATIKSELEEVRVALAETMRESERLSAQLEAEAAEKSRLSEQLTSVNAQLHSSETQRQTLATLYKASQVRVDSLEKTHAELDRGRRDLQARLDAALAAQASSKRRWEAADRELRAAREELDSTRTSINNTDTVLERVLEAFEGLSGASTIAELLVSLADMLALEFTRVALFRPKGNKLEGAYQVGFESSTDIGKVVIPLGMDSLLTRASASGCIESIEGDEVADGARAPFGGTPTCALALPVFVQGETFGILYADNGATPDAKDTATLRGWKGRFAELLLRHAIALLMRLTSELKALAELREHAARLLQHVSEMYASDADGGAQGADLRARLVENVECARRLYAQRVAVEGPAAAGLLEDQLTVLLEREHGTPFGRDLASIVDGMSARAAAEAS